MLIVEGQNDKLTIAARLKQGGRTDSTLLLAGAMMFPHSAPIEARATGSISPGSRLDEIRARGTLRVGMPGDYPPFGLRDKATGLWKGLDVDEAVMMAKAVVLLIIWHILDRIIWHTLVPATPCWPAEAPESSNLRTKCACSTHSRLRFGAGAPNN
jgi:hypothetical protein